MRIMLSSESVYNIIRLVEQVEEVVEFLSGDNSIIITVDSSEERNNLGIVRHQPAVM